MQMSASRPFKVSLKKEKKLNTLRTKLNLINWKLTLLRRLKDITNFIILLKKHRILKNMELRVIRTQAFKVVVYRVGWDRVLLVTLGPTMICHVDREVMIVVKLHHTCQGCIIWLIRWTKEAWSNINQDSMEVMLTLVENLLISQTWVTYTHFPMGKHIIFTMELLPKPIHASNTQNEIQYQQCQILPCLHSISNQPALARIRALKYLAGVMVRTKC